MPEREREGPPGRTDAEIPATFGKYFLTEKLATGGMGEIYLAKLVGPGGFEKQLVIKQIHPRLSGQRHFVDLFVAEAKILVTLAHGNIVPVYELGVIDDTYFIAMEYIDGPTLYRLTEALGRRGAHMAPAIAAWIAARIVEGLDYAHHKGEGVIHRDLSPRNVMLSRDGEVKLVDFGVAVTLGGAAAEDAGESAPTGSFPYMSPEQVRKQPLTGQTDLFSVGVLLWEMLVGRRLFARSNPDATLLAVVDSEIARPSEVNPAVPGRLDEVVMRALERDMTARWASANDMLAALQRYLYSLDETPGPRDVAGLVAVYCPPETRRLPTHHDELAAEGVRDATHPDPVARAASQADPRPGPHTAVIPRDGAWPRGRRQTRARTETFATHVALSEMLERGAPVIATAVPGGEAQRDDATPLQPRPPALPSDTPPEPAAIQLPGRSPPSRTLLVIGGLGALGLGATAIHAFFQGRGAVDGADVPIPDAAPAPPDADAVPPPDAAAPAHDAEPVDARPPGDARQLGPRRDAAHRIRPGARDPGELAPRPDATARQPGTATLTIGAIPWGTVLLDGTRIGRTPLERLSVPAGHHVVEVTFAGDEPPRTVRYTVELTDGEAKDLFADFTKP